MSISFKTSKKIFYFNSRTGSTREFSDTFYSLLNDLSWHKRSLVFLCIGSDRATGDSLGPLLGHRLKTTWKSIDFHVYGTLEEPVHAKNLSETLADIRLYHKNPLIVAIDASLGTATHVGYATISGGPLKPGAGVDKDLPSVGDISITGIVNISGILDQMLLQTTRLNTVMYLTEYIYRGLRDCIRKLSNPV